MSHINVVAFVTAPSGKEGELVEQFARLVPQTNAEPGCVSFTAFQHPKIANRFAVVQEYRDQAALDAHLQFDHTKSFIDWVQSSGAIVSFEFWNKLQ